MENHNDLLTPVEVAEMVRRPVKSLTTWRVSGYGPAWARIGGRIRYRRRDVEQFIEEQFAAGAEAARAAASEK